MPVRYSGILAAVCLLVCSPVLQVTSAEPVSDRQIIHVLNRIAFGPTLEDFHHVRSIGIDHYIAEQLNPESIPEPFELQWRIAALDTLRYDAAQLRELYGPLSGVRGFKLPPELETVRREHARTIVQQAAQARILRAILSPRQLQEVMVDFWFNHFNIFAGKDLDHLWIGDYERRAIRPFAMGRFRDLLFAATKHPAMLVYLDNTLSTAPGSPAARGNQSGLNENFAREVMELHTLGVDGGYTQEDVITLARILTGWSINRPDAREFPDHAAVFDGARHDSSPKVFLGHALRSRGKAEGEEALDILAKSPATARHIAFELAQYFVADEPPTPLVEQLAARFAASDGNIREMLRALFASREFWESYSQKYKTPYHFVISTVRAAGASVDNTRPLLGAMSQLGMPLFGCLTPDGYKNTEGAWLSPDATTRRINFATALAQGNLPIGNLTAKAALGASPDPLRPRTASMIDAARLEEIFGSTMSTATRETVAETPPELRAALILGSPDFMHR
ncbi:MAG: DUF1800 domain-containing protein [Alphaproteobacteria bacterium]|nr:DUF1800 domain-containing protein [Alphaproteobacteria bacterium]